MSNLCKWLLIVCIVAGCHNPSARQTSDPEQPRKKRPSALENDKFINDGNRKLLYGGDDPDWHFDITNSLLIDSQYHYGIGREQFDALIDPEFIFEPAADSLYKDDDRFLLFTLGSEARAYGIDLLTKHEVVNDVVNGEPVAAAYCILADLGAMYSRVIGGETLTFALSGYTYYDPEVWDGLDGFIWWDRETESTWWPLIGKGVSGDLIGVPLTVYDESNWEQTTWGNIRGKFENLKVLKPNQEMDPPRDWPALDQDAISAIRTGVAATANPPPRWGENSKE